MADYKILLVCSGGISTSLLMKKIEKYAEEHSMDIKVDAVGTASYEDRVSDYDVLLLGPQVAYRKKQIADSVAIPVAVIAPQDYAFCNHHIRHFQLVMTQIISMVNIELISLFLRCFLCPKRLGLP